MARVNFFFFFFFYFTRFNSTFLMPLCRTNSSSTERKRKRRRERERENDRLTGSMWVVVYACHGYWSMRNRWNNVHEKEEHTCKESVRFLFTAVDLFAIDINWIDGCCYSCPSFVMYVPSSPPFFHHIYYKE